jgi:hypothetical protein
MKLPRVRFTVQRMMVWVAIAGMVTGAAVLEGRRRIYASMAIKHAQEAYSCLTDDGRKPQLFGTKRSGTWQYHVSKARSFERAARYPWLRVEPDPPEPE